MELPQTIGSPGPNGPNFDEVELGTGLQRESSLGDTTVFEGAVRAASARARGRLQALEHGLHCAMQKTKTAQ